MDDIYHPYPCPADCPICRPAETKEMSQNHNIDAKNLVIEVGKELKIPDQGVAILVTGHSKARKLRIRVRQLEARDRRVKVKRLPRGRGQREGS